MITGEMALPGAAANWDWATDGVHERLFLYRGLGLWMVS